MHTPATPSNFLPKQNNPLVQHQQNPFDNTRAAEIECRPLSNLVSANGSVNAIFSRLYLSGCLKCKSCTYQSLKAVSANRKARAGLTTRESTAAPFGAISNTLKFSKEHENAKFYPFTISTSNRNQNTLHRIQSLLQDILLEKTGIGSRPTRAQDIARALEDCQHLQGELFEQSYNLTAQNELFHIDEAFNRLQSADISTQTPYSN